ncbi:PREDICTED: diuretic hormone receptor [Rhagoletis zephyria]|uniref:diuretic hormone receptor n=1 Tax=Rhagoletis zephyria TaxID=28612 RepID=UPI00081179F1|nr:PREDICTED: diuretic hormone receptor [Rhagoletis zephyria]
MSDATDGAVEGVGADDETLFEPYDNLDAINESTELQCLLQQHIDTTTYGNDSAYCLTHFDSILCWPRTPRGTLAALPCLHEFQGIQYDSSQNATRYCHANGTWEKYTNYDLCMHLPAPSTVPEFEPIVELPTIIYYIGYTISLVSLTLAIIVFVYFKELRCLRNSIHANLFFTYIMSALLWILTLSVHVLITKLRSANTVETRQYRKAAKALLVLIPLFGITYLVVLAGPSESGVMSNMFAVVRALLLSTQGFAVSLFYCFLNSEVRNTLRHHISTWRDERNIQLNQSRRYTTKSFSKDCSPRTESTRPLTAYYGKGKRESCVSSATTTTLLGHNQNLSLNVGTGAPLAMQRDSNGALHMMPTVTALNIMPRAISPLMKEGLEENSV